MLEIPNIMLVCKFGINWSTNKNLRALTTYLGRTGRTDARHFHIPRSALRGRGKKYTVKPEYKGQSKEPENVAFINSCPLYTD
jgi:hypothetical protein